jgi:uncharacterized damage-inducible protein DinB
MSTSASIAGEWTHETATTRRALERVPPESLAWKPHEKSYSMAELASHIANLPMWARATLLQDAFDLASTGGPMPAYESTAAILEAFDRNTADALEAIRSTPEEAWSEMWSLQRGGENVFTIPRIAALRAFILNHSIHHRGQLTVYLRQCGAPVPQIYGPTADEPDF